MSTNLLHAIDMAERLQHLCAVTTGKLQVLDSVIAEMKAHELEHGWINERLNMLVEIYNIVGADGRQCIDTIKKQFTEPCGKCGNLKL